MTRVARTPGDRARRRVLNDAAAGLWPLPDYDTDERKPAPEPARNDPPETEGPL